MQGQREFDSARVDGWDSAHLRQNAEWRSTIPSQGVREVIAHLIGDAATGRQASAIREEDFPALSEHATDVRDQLANHHGIVWIRPSPVDLISDDHHRELFGVFCSLLGMAHRVVTPIQASNPALATTCIDGLFPEVIGSVRTTSAEDAGRVEIVAASGVAVHRELELLQPELLRLLYRPVLHQASINAQTGEPTILRAPVFRYERSTRSMEFRYDRDHIEHAHAIADAPIDESMNHAFDALDKALNLPHLLASIRPDRGDIVLVNNKRVATAGISTSTGDVEQVVRALRVVNPHTSEVRSTVK